MFSVSELDFFRVEVLFSHTFYLGPYNRLGQPISQKGKSVFQLSVENNFAFALLCYPLCDWLGRSQPTEKQNQLNQSLLVRKRFPALGTRYMYLF